jgi:hypothetical protein
VYKASIHHLVPLTLLSTVFTTLACGEGGSGSTIDAAPSDPSSPGAAPDPAPPLDQDLQDLPPPCPKSTRVDTTPAWAPSRDGTDGASCGPTISAQTFSSALCSCENTNVAGYLRTRSFRSRSLGPSTAEPTPERLGGSVGVNQSYITGGWADVGGSFSVAGRRDVLFGGLLQVGQDLRFNPALDVGGIVQVGRDAALASALRAIGVIDIGRDLYQAPGSRFVGLALVDVGGKEHTQPVSVDPPCACGADEVLDISALVADARTNNDNAAVGLESHELDLVVGIGTALTLPSGRYHLHQIAGAGALQLRISGKVALFVDDDFYAGPLFRVSLDAGAELDLFVEDNLVLAGAALIGDPARPSATRVYAGGTGDIAVAGLNAFAGNVYAPNANVLVGGVGRVFGSLFGKNIIAAGILDVGYDESVGDGQVECPPPGDDPDDGSPGEDPPSNGDPDADPGDGDPTGLPPGGGGTPDGDEPGGDEPGDGSGSPSPCDPVDVPTVY